MVHDDDEAAEEPPSSKREGRAARHTGESVAEAQTQIHLQDEIDTLDLRLKDLVAGRFTEESMSQGVTVVGDDLLDRSDGTSITVSVRGWNLGSPPPPVCGARRRVAAVSSACGA